MNVRSRRVRRGVALITAMLMMAVMAMMIAMLMLYVSTQRERGAIAARSFQRATCAEAGLQYARGFFGRNSTEWDKYLARPPAVYDSTHPHPFNPVYSDAGNVFPADVSTDAGVAYIKAYSATPVNGANSFVDLDGDGQDDVYIYLRDNDDEIVPADPNWERDNDQNVIIGAICISSTMVPRRGGVLDRDALILESILSFNGGGGNSCQNTTGSGNMNCN